MHLPVCTYTKHKYNLSFLKESFLFFYTNVSKKVEENYVYVERVE